MINNNDKTIYKTENGKENHVSKRQQRKQRAEKQHKANNG